MSANSSKRTGKKPSNGRETPSGQSASKRAKILSNLLNSPSEFPVARVIRSVEDLDDLDLAGLCKIANAAIKAQNDEQQATPDSMESFLTSIFNGWTSATEARLVEPVVFPMKTGVSMTSAESVGHIPDAKGGGGMFSQSYLTFCTCTVAFALFPSLYYSGR